MSRCFRFLSRPLLYSLEMTTGKIKKLKGLERIKKSQTDKILNWLCPFENCSVPYATSLAPGGCPPTSFGFKYQTLFISFIVWHCFISRAVAPSTYLCWISCHFSLSNGPIYADPSTRPLFSPGRQQHLSLQPFELYLWAGSSPSIAWTCFHTGG